jgi:enterochelin esterase-like enzyme
MATGRTAFNLDKHKMRQLLIAMTMVTSLLAGCIQTETISSAPTATPPQTPECHESGRLITDSVLFPDTGENHSITIYLLPCYAEYPDTAYPVLYWTNGGFLLQQLLDTSDRLAEQGDVPAFINVLIQIDPNKGYGADAQILNDVVPYIDSHYRTQPDRSHRSITGFSNGAAIAIRAAFRAPDVFSRVAVLSGGIAEGEQEKFADWISAMPADRQPQVLIDVGDQDAILVLTGYLTDVLDQSNYPCTFVHGPGDHSSAYTDEHLENILKWLIARS